MKKTKQTLFQQGHIQQHFCFVFIFQSIYSFVCHVRSLDACVKQFLCVSEYHPTDEYLKQRFTRQLCCVFSVEQLIASCSMLLNLVIFTAVLIHFVFISSCRRFKHNNPRTFFSTFLLRFKIFHVFHEFHAVSLKMFKSNHEIMRIE